MGPWAGRTCGTSASVLVPAEPRWLQMSNARTKAESVIDVVQRVGTAWLLACALACKPEPASSAALPVASDAAAPVATDDRGDGDARPRESECPVACEATAARVCGAAPAVCHALARAIACNDADALAGAVQADHRLLVRQCVGDRCEDRRLDGRAELRWALDRHGGVAGLLGIDRCASPQLHWCRECRNNLIVGLDVGAASLQGEGQLLSSIVTSVRVDGDADHDAVGVLDDTCAETPESYDGIADADGCPEPGARVAVTVNATRDELVLATPLAFTALGGPLAPESADDLAQVAHFLRAHPREALSVHVTIAGASEAQVEAEASAIAAVLVAHGVAITRVSLVPIVDAHASAAQRRTHARSVRLRLVPARPAE